MTDRQTVWILMTGEAYEGGSVEGVYATEKDALKASKEIKPSYGSWEKSGDNVWSHGCDWMDITKHEVKV